MASLRQYVKWILAPQITIVLRMGFKHYLSLDDPHPGPMSSSRKLYLAASIRPDAAMSPQAADNNEVFIASITLVSLHTNVARYMRN